MKLTAAMKIQIFSMAVKWVSSFWDAYRYWNGSHFITIRTLA